MFCGVLAYALMSRPTPAQIFLDGNQVDYKVTRLEMMRNRVFNCPRSEAVFQNEDFDQDGVLDDMCIGLEYSPCPADYSAFVRDLIRTSITGGCFSLEEEERLRQRREACNGFSPQPDYCEGF